MIPGRVDTSPYAQYIGSPYNEYCGHGGQVVDNYNEEWDVMDFQNGETVVPDSIFGIFENKKKKAEKKLKKAEKKLAKGNTKAAERKIGKANKILDKIAAGQEQQTAAVQKLQNVNTTQAQLEQQRNTEMALPPSMSADVMTEAGSISGLSGGAVGGAASEISSNIGAESEAPDEPTGNLAAVKTLQPAMVKNRNKNIGMIIAAAIVLIAVIVFIVYSAKKKK